jgi:hypothetical protein
LLTLKKSVTSERNQVNYDEHAVNHEAAAYPRKELTSRGLPFYDTSEAKKGLEAAVSDGTLEEFAGRTGEFQKTNAAYLQFPSRTFAKHAHGERQKAIEKVGWQCRRNIAGSKKNHKRYEDNSNK